MRLVIKTNREHSTFTGDSFCFYPPPTSANMHTSTYPVIFHSIAFPVFSLNSISASLCFYEKQRHMLVSPSVRNGTRQARTPSSKCLLTCSPPFSSSFLSQCCLDFTALQLQIQGPDPTELSRIPGRELIFSNLICF